MANSICNISNIIPVQKSLLNSRNGYFYCNPKRNEVGLSRVGSSIKNGVKAMKGEKRENLDHLQRPAGLKKREVSSIPNGLWDRYPNARTVQQLMDTMDRMIDDPTTFATRWPPQSPPISNPNSYTKGRTPWEIMEQDTAYKMRFDMPGMTKKDVKIYVEEMMLVIKAAKAPRKKDGQENSVVVEDEDDWPVKSYGSYSTRIALPENVEFEKIKAQVKDGVLYLSVPKPCFKTKVFDINVD